MIVRTTEEVDLLVSWIEKNELIAFDLETTGLNPRLHKIVGVAVSNSEQGFYLPIFSYDVKSGELVRENSDEIVIRVLNLLLGKKLITWNGSFDTRFVAEQYDISLYPFIYIEGMLLKHTVDEERPFALKDVATKLFGHSSTKEQKEMLASIKANGGGANEFYKADLDLIAKYGIQDCLLTFRSTEYYLPKLRAEDLEDFFFKDEVMPLYKEVTIPMELRGVPVDVPALELAKREIEQDLLDLEDKIQDAIAPYLDDFVHWYLWKDYPPRRSGAFAQAIAEYAGLDLPKTASGKFSLTSSNVEALLPSTFRTYLLGGAYLEPEVVRDIQLQMWNKENKNYMFNISSKHHLKKIFFEELGEEPLSRTDKGNPQVNDTFIEKMQEKYDWCALLHDYNKLNKLKGSYVERILEQQESGQFYPSFQQHRTISGRYGSDIQQLPRPLKQGQESELVIKHNNKMRKFFITGEGCSFIDSDYESLEPHVFAHVSGDEGLKDIFKQGEDFYSTVAIKTENLKGYSADKKADNYLGAVAADRRQRAKSYALGIPYGMSAYKLHFKLDCSKDQAERLVQQYYETFPQLHKWMRDSENQCKKQGFARSEAGRIRHMPTARKIHFKYGDDILEPLKLWERYHDNPKEYERMKYLRKQMKNYLNNSKNFQIQSLAASIVNRSAIAINRWLAREGLWGYVCAQIHDQLIVRCRRRDAASVRDMVQLLMESTYKLSIPLRAPAEVASDWYEGH